MSETPGTGMTPALTPNGWPYLTMDNAIAAFVPMTATQATKLATGDYAVAQAVNAATAAQASATAAAASAAAAAAAATDITSQITVTAQAGITTARTVKRLGSLIVAQITLTLPADLALSAWAAKQVLSIPAGLRPAAESIFALPWGVGPALLAAPAGTIGLISSSAMTLGGGTYPVPIFWLVA